MLTYLVMIAGFAIIALILAYGVPVVRFTHIASAIVLGAVWFVVCATQIG